MRDRASIIKYDVSNNITNLDSIIKGYNKYAEGGLKDDNILVWDIDPNIKEGYII